MFENFSMSTKLQFESVQIFLGVSFEGAKNGHKPQETACGYPPKQSIIEIQIK